MQIYVMITLSKQGSTFWMSRLTTKQLEALRKTQNLPNQHFQVGIQRGHIQVGKTKQK